MSMSDPSAGDVAGQLEEAGRAMRSGALREAAALYRAALGREPQHLAAWNNLGAIHRQLGQLPEALQAAQEALKLAPRSWIAHYLIGSIEQQMGRARQAAQAFKIAIGLSPPPDSLDQHARAGLERAQALVEAVDRDYAAFLDDAMRDALSDASSAEATRAGIARDIMAGRRVHYGQQPLVFHWPGLPAIEFWDRAEFDWIETVEAATDAIRDELLAVLATGEADLTPYMKYGEGVPLDQWAELNNNPAWSAFHLIERGVLVPDNAARCPRTLAALLPVPQPDVPGKTPVAMFSILKPHTRIPPHTGAANTRLLCHLPLIVPENCSYRVGGSWRSWTVGEAFVFDDTIEHEARNDSDRMRAVLIFDLWNPRLTETDRRIIARLLAAQSDFYQSAVDWS